MARLTVVKSSAFFLALLITLCLFFPQPSSAWWSNSWLYKKQLSFDNSAQAENLTNFPVLVRLSAANFDFSKAQPTGADIRFVDSDDTTQLSYEIEKWDSTNQEAIIWVKIPQVDASSNTDYVCMYYGNSAATDAQSSSDVWDDNYVGVWHLKEDPTGIDPQMTDSTGTVNGGAIGGITSSTGKVGGAINLDGINEYIRFGSDGIGEFYRFERTDSFTIEAWAKPDTLRSGAIFAKQLAGGAATGYQLRLDASGAYAFFLNNTVSGNNYIKVTTNGTITPDTFNQIAATYDGSSQATGIKMYINDSAQVLTVNRNSLSAGIAASTTARIGSVAGPANLFDGVIDEVRVSDVVRSENWIAASYRSTSNTFITYSSESSVPTPSSSSVTTSSSNSSSPASPPSCSNNPPAGQPYVFQVNRFGNSAQLFFTPVNDHVGNYNVMYGFSAGDERFGLISAFGSEHGALNEGVQNITIHSLDPNTPYWFKVIPTNGCAVGSWSNWLFADKLKGTRSFFYSNPGL